MRFRRPPDHNTLNGFIILFVYGRCLHSAVRSSDAVAAYLCVDVLASMRALEERGRQRSSAPCLLNSSAQSLRATRFFATLRYSLIAVFTIYSSKFH